MFTFSFVLPRFFESLLLFLRFLIHVLLALISLCFCFCMKLYYFSLSYRIFVAARKFSLFPLYVYKWQCVAIGIHSCLTLRSIRKRARNITLRVNKYFSNKKTRYECTPLFHPHSRSFSLSLSIFPFLFLFNLKHSEADLFGARFFPTYRIWEKHVLTSTASTYVNNSDGGLSI